MKFLKDLAEHGARGVVAAIAAGVFLGTAAAKLVETFTIGILDPVLGRMFGMGNIARETAEMGGGVDTAIVSWGAVVVVALNLVLTVLLVWLGIRMATQKKIGKKK